jgi:uncharacterized protein YcbK (DUF882 family)
MAYITDGQIVKNFTLAEMTNKQATDEIKLILTPEVVEFAQMMQELRIWYNKSMTVNSWYRTKSYNAKCGGASNSVHLDGRACDIAIAGLTDLQFKHFADKWKQICKKHNKIGGINRYVWGIHLDDYEDKFGYKKFVIRDKR